MRGLTSRFFHEGFKINFQEKIENKKGQEGQLIFDEI
jgi:hypothetical protein